MNRVRLDIFTGHQPSQRGVNCCPVFFEKGWKVHQVGGADALADGGRLGIFLGFGIEGCRGHFTAGLFEQDFHLALGLLQVFLAIA